MGPGHENEIALVNCIHDFTHLLAVIWQNEAKFTNAFSRCPPSSKVAAKGAAKLPMFSFEPSALPLFGWG
jgi:hypothetical protein